MESKLILQRCLQVVRCSTILITCNNHFDPKSGPPGQAYVALSRATSLAGLQVLNFDAMKVRVCFSNSVGLN